MSYNNQIIDDLLNSYQDVRYVAIYRNNELVSKERSRIPDTSSSESDKYEEIIVNPTLLTLIRQRGNIDCGGLQFLIIRYGSFYQLIKEIKGGHISICLNKEIKDLTNKPGEILKYLSSKYPDLF